MILFDTNVLSELMRPLPELAVVRWIDTRPVASMFISAITEAELRYGAALLPSGKRQLALVDMIERLLALKFSDRILPFDSAAAVAYAQIASDRRQAGRPISMADAQIAAIARARGAVLATRNVLDFSDCGVAVVDPWASSRN